MKKIVLSAHQPDIFPWAGLFNKMNKSDFFDIAIYDEYSSGRYMDRVMMGKLSQQVLVNVPIVKKTKTQINKIQLKGSWKDLLRERIEKQYGYSKKLFPFYESRKYIVDKVLDGDHETLAEVGVASICALREELGIKCKIDILGRSLPLGTDGIIELSKRYSEIKRGEVTYLSGAGGRRYIDMDKIKESGLSVVFDDFNTKYQCSMLTPIFELENPKGILDGEK